MWIHSSTACFTPPLPGYPAGQDQSRVPRGSSAPIPPHRTPNTFCESPAFPRAQSRSPGMQGEIRPRSHYLTLPSCHLIALIMTYSNMKGALQKVSPCSASIPVPTTGTPHPSRLPFPSPWDFPIFSNTRYRRLFENAARWQLSHLSFKSHWIIFSIFLYGNQKFWLCRVSAWPRSRPSGSCGELGDSAGGRGGSRHSPCHQPSNKVTEGRAGGNSSAKHIVCPKVQPRVNRDSDAAGMILYAPKRENSDRISQVEPVCSAGFEGRLPEVL